METSVAVLQRAPVTAGDWRLCGRRTRRVLGEGFTDGGTMKYSVSCKAKKEEKKRAKLVKRLEKDLSAFYSMSPVVEPGVGLNEEDPKTRMISDAADLLLTNLKELRAEEKQMKRRGKEEKAKSMKNRVHNESSSSSSSDSSDSECETIVKMSRVNTEPKSTLERRLMQQRSMIEVCTGGKCKKSGALEVMEEFEKKVEGIN